jgi:uncharacterized membrane protein YhaH (DUF805 family)
MDKLTDNRFLFSFEGRINRLKYWYAGFASLISCLVFLSVLAFAIAAIFGASVKSVDIGIFDIFGNPPSFPFGARFDNADPASTATPMSFIFHAAGIPVFIFSMWFLAATTVKRLHDRNRSGWWIVLFFIAPALLGKIADRLGDSSAADLLTPIAFGLNLWGFVELMFLKGASGPNRYGPDPLAPVDTSARAASRWDQFSELEFVAHSAGPSPESHVKRGHE